MQHSRSPAVAAAAALIGGPLGFFYLGWRHGVAPSLVVLPWFTTLLLVNPELAMIVIAADLIVLSVEARRVARIARAWRSGKKAPLTALSSFTLPIFAFTGAMASFAITNVVLVMMLFAATLWYQGAAGWSATVVLLGVPLSAWVTVRVFRMTADRIDRRPRFGRDAKSIPGWLARQVFSRPQMRSRKLLAAAASKKASMLVVLS